MRPRLGSGGPAVTGTACNEGATVTRMPSGLCTQHAHSTLTSSARGGRTLAGLPAKAGDGMGLAIRREGYRAVLEPVSAHLGEGDDTESNAGGLPTFALMITMSTRRCRPP